METFGLAFGAPRPQMRGVLRDRKTIIRKRLDNTVLVGVPLAGTLAAPFWFSTHTFGLLELSSFIIGYIVIGLGVGAGFHRLFSHRSYNPHAIVKWTLAIGGSMSAQGSLLRWVMDHRRHHAKTDAAGDVHSPHIDHNGQKHSGFRGFFHAHVGWLFDGTATDPAVFARDLTKDGFYVFFHRTRWLWPALSLAIPMAFGGVFGGVDHAIGCLLVGGCAKITIFQNVVWAVNSFGHLRGHQPFAEAGESRNNKILAWLTLGDGWHNNHHAAPRSALHGFTSSETDVSGALILMLKRSGWASDVVVANAARSREASAYEAE